MQRLRVTSGLVVLLCVSPLACGKAPAASLAAPAPVGPKGPATPGSLYDPSAKAGFVAAQVYAPDSNGYPGCENPPQIDFGYTQVQGCPSLPVGTQLPMQSYCHMNFNFPITWYGSNPPASGDHWPEPSHDLGVNTTPIPREYYVHSMEHGAVILAYNCPAGCADKVAVLAQVVAARSDRAFKVLMTPDPLMKPNTFAAISWTWLYMFDTPDLQTLICFVDQHYDHARENDKVL